MMTAPPLIPAFSPKGRRSVFAALILCAGFASAQEDDPGPADAGLKKEAPATPTQGAQAPTQGAQAPTRGAAAPTRGAAAPTRGKAGRKPDPAALPGMEGSHAPAAAAAKKRSATGIHPVYDLPQGWLLFDRDGKPRSIAAGTQFVVVGSKATGVLSVTGTTMVDSCATRRGGKVSAYVLGGRKLVTLGSPIIALRAPKGRGMDLSAAKLYRLANEVNDDTYNAFGKTMKELIVEEVKAGVYHFRGDDSLGAHYSESPDPEKIQLKIDFGSKVRIAGVKQAFVLVEAANISRSPRRCVRLFGGERALGECAEMPHDLMVETQQLDFVAYDPSGKGQPFVLAYSTREPLWGHERWGFRLTKAGPKRFLMDALDPKCRERF